MYLFSWNYIIGWIDKSLLRNSIDHYSSHSYRHGHRFVFTLIIQTYFIIVVDLTHLLPNLPLVASKIHKSALLQVNKNDSNLKNDFLRFVKWMDCSDGSTSSDDWTFRQLQRLFDCIDPLSMCSKMLASNSVLPNRCAPYRTVQPSMAFPAYPIRDCCSIENVNIHLRSPQTCSIYGSCCCSPGPRDNRITNRLRHGIRWTPHDIDPYSAAACFREIGFWYAMN